MEYVYLVAGFALLVVGGEILVKGAVALALKFYISTLVIGMTVVSFGTSAPELLVSLNAALTGHPDIATGNVIGSNISNLALVLGITALIFPISVNRNTLKIDWPMMMFASLLFFGFVLDGSLVWWEGVIFLVILCVFLVLLVRGSRKQGLKEKKDTDGELAKERVTPVWKAAMFIIAGCVALAFGADWMVKGSSDIARNFGVSERVIGISLVAFGTSVPELVTSAIAAFRKQTDISVGNLIGSNIFNLFAILGITSVVTDLPVAEEMRSNDIYWMLGISALILPLMLSRMKVSRIEGGLLIASYTTYICLLFSSV